MKTPSTSLLAPILAFCAMSAPRVAHAGRIVIWTGDAWPRNFVYLIMVPAAIFLDRGIERRKAGESSALSFVGAAAFGAIFLVLFFSFMSDTDTR